MEQKRIVFSSAEVSFINRTAQLLFRILNTQDVKLTINNLLSKCQTVANVDGSSMIAFTDKERELLSECCDYVFTNIGGLSEIRDKIDDRVNFSLRFGSRVNEALYTNIGDSIKKNDPREYPKFWVLLKQVYKGAMAILFDGDSWADFNQAVLDFLSWATITNQWPAAIIMEVYAFVESQFNDFAPDDWRRGNVSDFNSAVAQE